MHLPLPVVKFIFSQDTGGTYCWQIAYIYRHMIDNIHLKLIEDRHFKEIPAASGIEYLHHRFYVTGDEAAMVYCLDEQWRPAGNIRLRDYNGHRLPKAEKQDWEAITVLEDDTKNPVLLLLGSGSLSPQRDYAAVIHWSDGSPIVEQYSLTSFYQHLIARGIRELNIEAAATLPDGLLLANRGHTGSRENHLILCSPPHIWQSPPDGNTGTILITSLHLPYGKEFAGISGMCYWPEKDWLFFTTSTEATASTYDDGQIGESMLGIIYQAKEAIRAAVVQADYLLPLTTIAPAFHQQKIESVCLVPGTDHCQLVLVADNDDGTSHFFRLSLMFP